MPLPELDPIVALTGAGISAESGVPTFRGEGGLWENHRAQDLATPQAFRQDPDLVWRFYAWRRQLVRGCRPNRAHTTLAEIERMSDHFTLISQNVDGLHQRAGSKNIVELHGSLWRLRCTVCGERWEDLAVPFEENVPHCPNCNAFARPDVVWFGESLNEETIERAFEVSKAAKTFLIIGTSAVVHPAASLPLIAKREGAHLLEFNLEETPLTKHADEVHRGPASARLSSWWQQVN